MNKTPVRVLSLAAGLIAGLAGTPSAIAEDWPQFRGVYRDGKSAEKGLMAQWPEGGPKLLWSVDGVGKGFSHVSVADGLVYVTGLAGTQGILRAYTLDGRLAWQAGYGPEYDKAHPGARTIPTIHEGLVYVMSGLGRLSCFTAADGKPVWSVDVFALADAKGIQWGFAESVLIDKDKVFVTPIDREDIHLLVQELDGRNAAVITDREAGT